MIQGLAMPPLDGLPFKHGQALRSQVRSTDALDAIQRRQIVM
jgi:hypothetical protein